MSESDQLVERLKSLLEKGESLAPFEENRRKQKFLEKLLQFEGSLLKALSASRATLTDFLAWRKTDELFEYLYCQHLAAIDEDVAADIRQAAKSEDASLAQKVNALQTLNPGYDRAIKKEQMKGDAPKRRPGRPPRNQGASEEIDELESRILEPIPDPLADPTAAVKPVDIEEIVKSIPEPSIAEQLSDDEDPVKKLADEAARTWEGQALLHIAGLK